MHGASTVHRVFFLNKRQELCRLIKTIEKIFTRKQLTVSRLALVLPSDHRLLDILESGTFCILSDVIFPSVIVYFY